MLHRLNLSQIIKLITGGIYTACFFLLKIYDIRRGDLLGIKR